MNFIVSFTDKEIEFLIKSCLCNYAADENDISFSIEEILDVLVQNKNHLNLLKKHQCFSKEPINKKLFMGNGKHSVIALNKLHKRLQFAAHELGALEQNGGMGTEFDEDLKRDCVFNIVSVIKDIMVAFDVSVKDL